MALLQELTWAVEIRNAIDWASFCRHTLKVIHDALWRSPASLRARYSQASEEAQRKKSQEDEQVKRDRLLQALDADTKKKSKKFFGLF
jgi:hypothetical protein